MRLPNPPKIALLQDLMNNSEMQTLHQLGDVFVLPTRAEGWGMPYMEALTRGNPCIATSYGGQTEYLNKSNSWPVPYTLTPVYGMSWIPWYKGDQWWAEPDIYSLSNILQDIYRNPQLIINKRRNIKRSLSSVLSEEKIRGQFKHAFKETIRGFKSHK